jgi:hypothetical protein
MTERVLQISLTGRKLSDHMSSSPPFRHHSPNKPRTYMVGESFTQSGTTEAQNGRNRKSLLDATPTIRQIFPEEL